MDWDAPVDAYCERLDASFWSEPLNAVSNLAFLIAAAAAARLALGRNGRGADVPVLALSGLVAVIGIGSFLFHTLANRWSLLADVLPITAFIYAYFFLVLRRGFGLGWPGALAGTALFLGGSIAFGSQLPDGFLNGSGGYLPAWLAMLIIGAMLRARGHPGAGRILAAAAVFTLSLTFRTLDASLCDVAPTGLHMLWHLLNAVTLYLLLSAMDRARPISRDARSQAA